MMFFNRQSSEASGFFITVFVFVSRWSLCFFFGFAVKAGNTFLKIDIINFIFIKKRTADGVGIKRSSLDRGKSVRKPDVSRHPGSPGKTCLHVAAGNPRNASRRLSYPGGFGVTPRHDKNGHARRPPGSFPSAHGDAPPLATLFRRVFCRSVSAISGARPFFPHSAAVPLERQVRVRSARRLVQQFTAPAVDTPAESRRYVKQTPAVRSLLFLKNRHFVQNFTLLPPPSPGVFSGFFLFRILCLILCARQTLNPTPLP